MTRPLPVGTWSRLLAAQWGMTLGSVIVVAGVVRGTWGVWLPVGAYLVGTALWGWSGWGAPLLRTRAVVRQLAWGAGWRGGVFLGLSYLTAALLRPDVFGLSVSGVVAVSALMAPMTSVVLTMLTVVALDAARSGGEPSGQPEA